MRRQRPGGRPATTSAHPDTPWGPPRGAQTRAEPFRPGLDTTDLVQRARGQQQLPEWLDRRDTAPLPGEVILPTLYGLGIVPTETPRMFRGSVFAENLWGEPEE